MNNGDRRIQRIKRYVEENLGYLPPEKDENDDADDMVNDAIRETLEEVQNLLTGPLGKTFAEIHITGEGFRHVSVYRLFFKAALREVRANHEAYEAEVRDWYENGEGAAPDWRTEHDDEGHTWRWNAGGLGHTFPYCIHGSSLQTDYDNICGWCEDSSSITDEARLRAREQYLRFNDRWDWATSAPGDLGHEERNRLLEWATSLFPRLDTVSGD